MIPPVRPQLTPTAVPASLTAEGGEPSVPFQELLAELGAGSGFLAIAPLPPPQEGGQRASAEIFNEAGFFSRSDVRRLEVEPEAVATRSDEREGAKVEDCAASSPAAPRPPALPPVDAMPGDRANTSERDPDVPVTRLSLLRTDFTPPRLIVSAALLAPEGEAPLPGCATSTAPPGGLPTSKSALPEKATMVEAQCAKQTAGQPPASTAATRTAVALSRDATGVTVAARIGGLDVEERARLERRIVEELARHGLTISAVVLTGAAASRDEGGTR